MCSGRRSMVLSRFASQIPTTWWGPSCVKSNILELQPLQLHGYGMLMNCLSSSEQIWNTTSITYRVTTSWMFEVHGWKNIPVYIQTTILPVLHGDHSITQKCGQELPIRWRWWIFRQHPWAWQQEAGADRGWAGGWTNPGLPMKSNQKFVPSFVIQGKSLPINSPSQWPGRIRDQQAFEVFHLAGWTPMNVVQQHWLLLQLLKHPRHEHYLWVDMFLICDTFWTDHVLQVHVQLCTLGIIGICWDVSLTISLYLYTFLCMVICMQICCLFVWWHLLWQATRAMDVFAKHVDSVLAKCAKVRGLIADLQKNYPECPTAKKFLGWNQFGYHAKAVSFKPYALSLPVKLKHSLQGRPPTERWSPNLGHAVQRAGRTCSQGREGWPQSHVAK